MVVVEGEIFVIEFLIIENYYIEFSLMDLREMLVDI